MGYESHQGEPVFPTNGAATAICCHKPKACHDGSYRYRGHAEDVSGPAGRVAEDAWLLHVLHGEGFLVLYYAF